MLGRTVTVSRPMRSAAISSTLLNHMFGSRPRFRASRRSCRIASRPGVVGGKGEQPLVQPVHRLVLEVLVHHEAHVLHAGVDVGLDLA